MAGGAKPELKQGRARESSEPDSSIVTSAARPARILCVDDEPGVLAVLSRALGNRFEIVTRDDPVVALALLEKQSFSVVISDLRMPQMDGEEFLAHAKRLAPGSSRLALTACLDRDLTAEQVFGILTKPCPLRLLNESVTAAVQHHLLLEPQPAGLQPERRMSGRMSSASPPESEAIASGVREKNAPRRRLVPAPPAGLPPSIELALLEEAPVLAQSPWPSARAGQVPGTLGLLAAVAQKFFMLGQSSKAERMLRASLEDLAVRARQGAFPAARDAEIAVDLALQLAEETRDPSWIDYAVLLSLDLRRPLSQAASARLHVLMRQVPGANPATFRQYLEALRVTESALGELDRLSCRPRR